MRLASAGMRNLRIPLSFALLLSVVLLAPSTAEATTTGSYVALGDSYAAGPVIPTQIVAAGLCLRSNKNFAHKLAPVIAAQHFRDVSCSGATTTDMTHTQSLYIGSAPAQFNALSADTSIVTLEIG